MRRAAMSKDSTCTRCRKRPVHARGLCAPCYAGYLRERDPESARERQRRYRASRPQQERDRAARQNDRHLYGGMRSTALARHGHACVDCGTEVGDSTGRGLSLHHADGSGIANGKKGSSPNNDPDNLVALCCSCHMKRHQRELGRGVRVVISCGYCGKPIEDFPWHHRRFCNRSCQMRARWQRKRAEACA